MIDLQRRIDRAVEYRSAGIDWTVGSYWGSFPECDSEDLRAIGLRRWRRGGRVLAALLDRQPSAILTPDHAAVANLTPMPGTSV